MDEGVLVTDDARVPEPLQHLALLLCRLSLLRWGFGWWEGEGAGVEDREGLGR